MEELALKLKSHSTRMEACKEIIAEMKSGNIKAAERDAIMEVLKEPWVEQHDITARLTWYGLLSQYSPYLKKHGDALIKDVAPFLHTLYSHKKLPLYRTPALTIILETITKLTNEFRWKSSDIDTKIIYIHLKNLIDRNSPQYDVVASTRVGICLLQNGLVDLVNKYYGERVNRIIDIVLNEKLLKELIRDSILRFSCDPLFKDVFTALSQLEKQNDVSKKMWKEYLQLGNSSNMVYKTLFYEILASFIANNQNRKIFLKILKTKAMVQLTKNLDTVTAENAYFSGLVDRLSMELSKLNENPRFRKLIFPSVQDYKSELADVSKMVIFATGASEKIFSYITELPNPFPEAFLLNINNVDTVNISDEFMNALFDFSFAGQDENLIDELDLDDDVEDMEDAEDNNEENDDDDDAVVSDLITDHDDLIEKAQNILLETINRLATWHKAPKLTKLVQYYKSKLEGEEESPLQSIFSEEEEKLRQGLFNIREKLLNLEREGDDEDKRQALLFLVEGILIHQLYIPSLITEESNVVVDLEESIKSLFNLDSKKKKKSKKDEDAEEKEPNPIEVLTDVSLQLVSVNPKLTTIVSYCLKYFLKGQVNDEVVEMLTSVIYPALAGQDNGAVFEENADEISEDGEDADEEMNEDVSFTAMEDKIDASDDEAEENDEGASSEKMEMVNFEDIEDFDQDEYMFKHDEVLRQMFLIKKRQLDREKIANAEAGQVAYNSAASSLQIIETLLRHTYHAEDVMKLFVKLLKMYMSRLQRGQLKKFSAMTHQKIVHTLSIIYKTPLLLNTAVDDRKREKGTTHKYYGRFDAQIPALVKVFFEFIEVFNKIPSQQGQPLVQFFKDIFVTHPDRESTVVPLIQEQLKKKIMASSKFSAPKAVAFLVSTPWMAESCSGLLLSLLKKFAKKGAEVFRFVQSCLDKKLNLFSLEGSFDQFISYTLERLEAEVEEKKEKIGKNIKSIQEPVRAVLRRCYTNPNMNLSEETKQNMVKIASIFNSIKATNWAPLLENEKKERKRKKRDGDDSLEEEKPKKRVKQDSD